MVSLVTHTKVKTGQEGPCPLINVRLHSFRFEYCVKDDLLDSFTDFLEAACDYPTAKNTDKGKMGHNW